MDFNLIIIGGGPGGYKTATYAASKGLTVLVVEKDELGGTCLNRGCIPTKTYARLAEVIETMKDAGSYALDGVTYSFDFAKAFVRKQQVVETLRGGIATLLSASGITLVKGMAVMKDAHTVVVDGKDYSADNIIIATGSVSKSLPIPDLDKEMVCDSDWLLDTDVLPKRICIVGAGVIGMEFASILNSFGCEVTVVEFLKECLPMIDKDLAKRLRKKMEKDGIKFNMGYSVESIASLQADAVLVATGRKPNLDEDELQTLGIEYDRRGIVTDNNMQTSVTGIYAIGDVNGKALLAHAATFQGFRAVNHILQRADSIRLDIMPSAVFTDPEVATVGLTDDACKKEGITCKVHKGFYRSNGKALADEATEGLAKIVTDDEGRIIGCHILGAHAADMVQEIAALMNQDVTLAQLADIVHIHPTLGEIIQDIAINS